MGRLEDQALVDALPFREMATLLLLLLLPETSLLRSMGLKLLETLEVAGTAGAAGAAGAEEEEAKTEAASVSDVASPKTPCMSEDMTKEGRW